MTPPNYVNIRQEYDFPPRPRPKPKKGKKPSPPPPIGVLQASAPTAGLYGTLPLVLVPFWNPVSSLYLINYWDSTDFDSEEPASYNFKIEEVDDKAITIHKIIVTYRDLGVAKFTLGFNYYLKDTDLFYTVSVPVQVGSKQATGKQRKKPVDVIFTGEAVQMFITRASNSGPLSIIRIRVAGHAGEFEFV